MTDRGPWQENFVQYNPGDIVEYHGSRYKIIQPHKSQPDWNPSITPALWENLGSSHHGGAGSGQPPQYHQQHQQQQPQYVPPPQPQQTPSNWQSKPEAPGSYTTDTGTKVNEEESKKKWYDLDDSKKTTLLAGGLALGLGALAGGAYYAHQKHRKQGEDEKAQAWEIQNWLIATRQRTEEYLHNGPRGPVTWVSSEYLNRPEIRNNLIPGGEEDGQPWYIARAPHNGGLQPGRARPGFGAFFGYGNEAVHVKQYEILVGDARAVRWIPHSGHFDFKKFGARPVEGGHEDDGTPLVIARAHAKEKGGILGLGKSGQGGLFPGKASTVLSTAYVTVGDKEVKVEDYEVLAYV